MLDFYGYINIDKIFETKKLFTTFFQIILERTCAPLPGQRAALGVRHKKTRRKPGKLK